MNFIHLRMRFNFLLEHELQLPLNLTKVFKMQSGEQALSKP